MSPKQVEECVDSILDDPDATDDEDRAWAICKAQQEAGVDAPAEVVALADTDLFAEGLDTLCERRPAEWSRAESEHGVAWIGQQTGATVYQSTPEGIPEDARSVSEREECDGRIVEGERGGLWCVPEDADGGGDDAAGEGPPDSVDLSKEVDSITLDDAGIEDGSNRAAMRIAELEDGGQAFVEEDYEDWVAEKELAGVAVYEQLDVPIPDHHYYEEDNEMAKAAVEGQTIHDAMRGEGFDTEEIDTDSVVDAFAASLIAGDTDLHGGNIMVREDGVAVPIDVEGSGGPVRDRADKQNKIETMLDAGDLDVEYDDIWNRAQEMAADFDPDALPEGETDMAGIATDNIAENAEAIAP